jgi:hypothetical protein
MGPNKPEQARSSDVTRVIPETSPDYDKTRIIERPDGFYWQSKVDGREFGPFVSLIEAVHDMQYEGENEPEPGVTVEEAEASLGIAEWTDPTTGEPAEEGVPRLEEH